MATLNFKGKSAIWNHHLSVPYQTLDVVAEMSHKGKDADENLIIEGDNLVALKSLLPKYQGKVKCIYIDPPYNTGNEGWVYNDNVNNPLIKEWIGKTVGKEGEDFTRHDKWLCMMTPRLKLLRELLADDGVIFVSIDEHEYSNLNILMNDMYMEENRIGEFVWHKKLTGGYDNKFINTQHEYILCYAKNKESVTIIPDIMESKYTLVDEEGKKFKWDSLWNVGGLTYSPSLDYSILAPDGTDIYPAGARGVAFWLWSKSKVDKERDRLKFEKDKNGNWKVYKRVYASDGIPPSSLLDKEIVKGNTNATAEIKRFFDEKIFDFSKPSSLIKYLISKVSTNKNNDIILDSFAGSGTTAQAVLEMNKGDGGNRKFILVQIPESTPEDSPAHLAGYKSVQQITQARVKKVIEREHLDVGFTYYKLGKRIDAESILSGDLPTYQEFARYVYYLATGKNFPEKGKMKEEYYFVGKAGDIGIFLLYTEVFEDLKTMALTLDMATKMHKEYSGKKFVYAPACFLDEEHLEKFGITFIGIPFNLFERN